MAGWSELNAGRKSAVALVILIVVGGVGYGLWHRAQPAAVKLAATAPVVDAAAAPVVDAAAAPVVDAAAAPVVDAAAVAVPVAQETVPVTSLDLVRIETDGTAIVAGRAPVGSDVSLRANGVEVAQAKTDQAGKFVAMFTMPASASGQMLTMAVTMPDGSKIAAGVQVAIAMISPPVVAAATSPATPQVATAEPTTAEPTTAEPTPTEATPTEAATTTAPAAVARVAEAPATALATALAVTDAGVKVLQNGSVTTAETVSNVALDVIAYPSPEQVQFGGHGVAGQFIRLYLDNMPLGDAVLIPQDGRWSETLDGIAPRIYTLRVDQVDAGGKVTSRFETPFKRETPAALAAAMGATAVADAGATAPAPDIAVPSTSGAQAATTAPADGAVPADNSTAPADTSTATPSPAATSAPAVTPEASAADTTTVVQVTPAKPASPVTVTVQPGYTLWFIAKQNFGEGVLYVQVFEANRDKIRNPDLIYPGQVFTIPAKK